MAALTRTLLRHQMLHAISTGRVDRAKYGTRTWEIRSSVSVHRVMDTAVSYLVHGGAARIDAGSGQLHGQPVVLTDAGAELLANWNTKHGDVTT